MQRRSIFSFEKLKIIYFAESVLLSESIVIIIELINVRYIRIGTDFLRKVFENNRTSMVKFI